MCFAPEADVATAVVVGALGIDAWRHVGDRRERPLAALPLVLAAHQLIQAFVWWGLRGEMPNAVWQTASWVYLAVAFGLLPVFIPFAVAALEPGPRPRRMTVLLALGAVVAAVLMYGVVRGPVDATIEGHHIAYAVDLWHGGLVTALYVVATCGSLLVSHHRYVRRFGAWNLAAVVVLAWLDRDALISLWCAWAAVVSVAIALHLRLRPATPVLAESPT